MQNFLADGKEAVSVVLCYEEVSTGKMRHIANVNGVSYGVSSWQYIVED